MRQRRLSNAQRCPRIRASCAPPPAVRRPDPSDGSGSWYSQGESNPCFRRERAASWTARRWERGSGADIGRNPGECNQPRGASRQAGHARGMAANEGFSCGRSRRAPRRRRPGSAESPPTRSVFSRDPWPAVTVTAARRHAKGLGHQPCERCIGRALFRDGAHLRLHMRTPVAGNRDLAQAVARRFRRQPHEQLDAAGRPTPVVRGRRMAI